MKPIKINLECGHTTYFRRPVPRPGEWVWCHRCVAFVLRTAA